MRTKAHKKTGAEQGGHPLAIRFPKTQRQKIKATAKKLGLSETDTIRQSVNLGLSALEKALQAA